MYICHCVHVYPYNIHIHVPAHLPVLVPYQSQIKEDNTRLNKLRNAVAAVKGQLMSATEQSTAEQQQLDKEVHVHTLCACTFCNTCMHVPVQVAELESKCKRDKECINTLEREIAAVQENHIAMTSTMGAKLEELERSAEEYKVRMYMYMFMYQIK